MVHRFIALTEFARDLLIQGGLPGDRIVIKPNFLTSDPGIGSHRGNYALFVGRLSPEKGIDVLRKAWDLLADQGIPLVIAGDGPWRGDVLRCVNDRTNVTYKGRLGTPEILELMKNARV